MALSIAALWLTISFVLLFFLLPLRHGYRRYNLPPGPKPWPIIGNLHTLFAAPLHRSLHALSQKYGAIMSLRLGSNLVVVGSSAQMAQAFLKTHDASLASRPKTTAGKYTTYNYSNILWAPHGPQWRQARRLCFTELFSPKSMESSEYIRKEEMKTLINNLFISSNKAIVLKENLNILNLGIISRMVLGKKYVERTGNGYITPEEFKHMLDEFFFLNGCMNIGDLIPWIGFLDLQGYVKRMKVLSEKFDGFMEYVLDEHIERRKRLHEEDDDENVDKDMVDVLLKFQEDPKVKLERHRVKAITQDLLIGGTQTSAITVEWAMSELLRKPEILKEATKELDKVIGKERWIEEQDILKLPYIKAIVKETMRLHPALPTLVPRLALEDSNINGYDIPKGTQVLVNVWAIGRDPTIWDNPYEFEPERFLIGKNYKANNIDVEGHDFELLPFGAGRRMCVGYPLGLKVIQTCLANLIHGFDWKLGGEMKKEELNMEEGNGLSIARKIPLEVMVEPRLPLHLYSLP
ncbi:cytochrome P450 71A1-like [Senna tora]|uniref:Cytochrome P450 71A1-like n=1 Tax=Senna tora TaxID=362788 RepID=A0A834XFY8_9FABA|nr:cytochrome P450 71A1-like [Senna tora]